jgi:hypothetical protein
MDEQKGGDQHGKNAADQIKIRHHQSVAVAVIRKPHHVLRPDIGNHERCPDRPLRQRAHAEKQILSGKDPPPRPAQTPTAAMAVMAVMAVMATR